MSIGQLDIVSAATLSLVERHNACWAQGDIAGIEALYHPDMVFIDHFTGNRYTGTALREHIRDIIARSSLDTLEYLDRPRVDGDTVFLRYCEVIRAANGDVLLSVSACDSVRIADDRIIEINEYALPMQKADQPRRKHTAGSKIGLSPRALGYLLKDLSIYFEQQQPYLEPGLSLSDVARVSGYTRNQISYALNQGLGLTFYQYLNRARIRHVLASDSATSIVERAKFAGFRSTSTFYSAFRAYTGHLPGDLLK